MPTIGGSVVHNAVRVPDRLALVAGDLSWTWSALNGAVAGFAGRLQAAGVCHGDRVGVLVANSAEFLIACHAASRLGAIVLPINTRLAPPEVAFLCADADAALLVYSVSEVDLAFKAVAAGLGRRPELIKLDATDVGDAEPVWEDRAAETDDAFLLYTSGTTGRPKGVVIDHHRAVWAAMAQVVSMGLRDGERYLHLVPMYHSGGTTLLNTVSLISGTHVIAPSFEPSVALRLIETHRITLLFGVPTIYQFMMRSLAEGVYDLSSWRYGVFGAAPMPASAVEQLVRTFPQVEFFQQCGQTEAGPSGIYSTLEQIRSRPDSSGHIGLPFTELRVVDAAGTDVRTGVGELLLRGESAMKGYWNNPDATAQTVQAGWLHTGDLMVVTADGAMRLVDRLKDVIITGGRNVYSAEVEQAIARHPRVIDVAVVGHPDPDWGSTVVAVVTVDGDADFSFDDLRAHCLPLIADYKIPRRLVLGDVPRNGAGKIQKHLIREALPDV